ncbi:MAG: LysR family transcriptional regulator [Pseudomonadota bacterium]
MHARDLRLLLYFTEIVKSGSIRGAARALNVSPPVVSTALGDLEALIGITLIRRTTRRLELTDTGSEVHSAAEAMCRHAGAAMNVAAGDRPVTGTLRISAPVELANYWLPGLLSAYRARWPEVRLFVDAADTVSDPQARRIDLSVRATFQVSRADALKLRPRPVAILPVDLVCAPSLTPGEGALASRLARTGYIGTSSGFEYQIVVRTAAGRSARTTVQASATSEDRLAVLAMARQGLGAALLIRDTVEDDLANGRLIRVAPDLDFGVVGIRALPADPQPAPPVLAFLRLIAELSPTPDQAQD